MSLTTTSVHQLIASRRTTFQFQDRPVPDEVLERALQAAQWAPNHKLTYPWRFVLPGPEMTRRLAARMAAKREAKLRARGADEAAIAQALAEVPPVPAQVLVYTVQGEDARRNREDYAASCAAVQNLMLAAWSEGVASGWRSFDDPSAYELFGLDPATSQIVGLLELGYPAREREGHRRPLDAYVSRTP